jgi:hypothetical protein
MSITIIWRIEEQKKTNIFFNEFEEILSSNWFVFCCMSYNVFCLTCASFVAAIIPVYEKNAMEDDDYLLNPFVWYSNVL